MTTQVAYDNRLPIRLLLVLLLALLPCTVVILQSALAQRAAAVERAQRNGRALIQAIINRQSQLLQSTAVLLELLAQNDAIHAGGRRCEDFLARVNQRFPGYAVLGTVTPQGIIACNSRRDYRFFDVSDRAYVRLGLTSGQAAVGEYQIGRLTGKPTINMSHPIRDQNGQLTGLIYAAVELSWISQVAPIALLPSDAELTLSNHVDMVLLRRPAGAPAPGHPYAEGPRLRARLQQQASGAWWDRNAAGEQRLYTVHRLTPKGSSTPAFVTVSQPRSAIFADANRQLGHNLLVVGVWLALIGGLGWRYRDRLSG